MRYVSVLDDRRDVHALMMIGYVYAYENECGHVCLRAHVNGCMFIHMFVLVVVFMAMFMFMVVDRDGDGDDQSHQRCHGLFHHVPYAHRSPFPKYYFSRCGLHEDDKPSSGNGLKGFF